MSEHCPHCGQEMNERVFKVTAGYYSALSDYLVKADSPSEAESIVRKMVKQVYPNGDVVKVVEA